MTCRERLDKLLRYQDDIINSGNAKEIEIKSKIFDSWYEKIVGDLEILEILKKYIDFVINGIPEDYYEIRIYNCDESKKDFDKVKEWLEEK